MKREDGEMKVDRDRLQALRRVQAQVEADHDRRNEELGLHWLDVRQAIVDIDHDLHRLHHPTEVGISFPQKGV